MDYFTPGLREFSRILGRQTLRLHLFFARRRLAQAEATLGLLGWQQADFDETTQQHVRRLVDTEREQARITNESAGVGRALRELSEARLVGRKHFEGENGVLETQRQQAGAAQEKTGRLLAERRRSVPSFEQRMPELDRELRETNQLFAELLAVQPATPQIKHEIIRLRERIVAIPNEKNDLRMLHLRAAHELRTLEARHEREQAVLAGVERGERELAAAFKRADHELAGQIRELERQRAALDREFESLESAKANPYRELGRVLADNAIAPMNQPQALEAVQRRRLVVQEHGYRRALSSAATEKENPLELRRSLWIWAGLAAALAGFVITLLVLA